MDEERLLQESRGQYTIVLPVQLIRALGWKKGDTILVLLDMGDIRLRKKKD